MLSVVDIVLLGVMLVSGLIGLWRGFVVEVLSLTVWALAFWAAFALGDRTAGLLAGWIDTQAVRTALGYVGTFIAVLVLGGLCTWAISRVIQRSGLSGTDRSLGFAFGLLRGVAVCVLGILMLGFTALPETPDWQQSRLLAVLQPGAEWLRSWLPEKVAEQIRFPATLPESLLESLPAVPSSP